MSGSISYIVKEKRSIVNEAVEIEGFSALNSVSISEN